MFVVERARNDDVERLIRLAHETGRDVPPASWLSNGSDAECLVARDTFSRMVLGFAVAKRGSACDAELEALAVDSNQQGRGVGDALLRTVQNHLRQAGAMRLHLDVPSDDVAARDFYLRHGYAPEGATGAMVRWARPI